MLFGKSLKSLLENYEFGNGRSIVVKDFSLESINDLDVIVSDYKFSKLHEFISTTKIKRNKLKEIDKIFIIKKGAGLLPKANIQLQQPFRIFELVDVLKLIFEKMKTKRANKIIFGYISFIISERKLIYKDKRTVGLTEKESDIILCLLNSGKKGIKKEKVMSQVWMLNPNMETHTFETHLYRLRKKIKENLFLNNFIMNEGGTFYLNHKFLGKKN